MRLIWYNRCELGVGFNQVGRGQIALIGADGMQLMMLSVVGRRGACRWVRSLRWSVPSRTRSDGARRRRPWRSHCLPCRPTSSYPWRSTTPSGAAARGAPAVASGAPACGPVPAGLTWPRRVVSRARWRRLVPPAISAAFSRLISPRLFSKSILLLLDPVRINPAISTIGISLSSSSIFDEIDGCDSNVLLLQSALA